MNDDNTTRAGRARRSGGGELEAVLRRSLRNAAIGDALPSVRQLTKEHGVSATTVRNVFAALSRDGLIEARPGAGTFVLPKIPAKPRRVDYDWQLRALGERRSRREGSLRLPPRPGVLDLSVGYLDAALQPTDLLRRATERVARRGTGWGTAGIAGLDDLRAWFAHELRGDAKMDDVLIAPGGQAALSLALRALVPPGETLVVESPTYFGALEIAHAAGIRLAPAQADDEGICPEALPDVLDRTRARAIYLQPDFANPTGTVLSATRRAAILRLARERGLFLIEDDYARGLSASGTTPLAAGEGAEHVIYIRSLTKVVAPSMRIAAVVARGPVLERLSQAMAVDHWLVSRWMQEVAHEVVTHPSWDRHVRHTKEALLERQHALTMALTASAVSDFATWARVAGGYGLWLRLHASIDDRVCADAAERHDVRVVAGRAFFVAEPSAGFLRVNFAALDAAQAREAARRLGRALESVMPSAKKSSSRSR